MYLSILYSEYTVIMLRDLHSTTSVRNTILQNSAYMLLNMGGAWLKCTSINQQAKQRQKLHIRSGCSKRAILT